MFERGPTLAWAWGPFAGLAAQLLLLVALTETVGVGRAGLIVGLR